MQSIAMKASTGEYKSADDTLGDLLLLEAELAPQFSKTGPSCDGMYWYRDSRGAPQIAQVSYKDHAWIAKMVGHSVFIECNQLRGEWSFIVVPEDA